MEARLLCKLPRLIVHSAQNAAIRRYRALQEKKRRREREGALVVEGLQEIRYALRGNYRLELLLCREGSALPEDLNVHKKVEVAEKLFDQLSYRGEAAPYAAIFLRQAFTLPAKRPKKVLILEEVEKPGNLGAIFRTALASGCDLLLTTGCSTDFYNPNCIRSSVGTVFLLPHIHLPHHALMSWLKEVQLPVFTTALNGAMDLYTAVLPPQAAFVFGAEHAGISDKWTALPHTALRIPMQAEMDSLNLAASAAVVLYEHFRQHG